MSSVIIRLTHNDKFQIPHGPLEGPVYILLWDEAQNSIVDLQTLAKRHTSNFLAFIEAI